MNIETIIEKLFGNIKVHGITEYDKQSIENLGKIKIILNYLINQLSDNSRNYIDSKRYSENLVANYSFDILKELQEYIENTIDSCNRKLEVKTDE